MDDRKAQLGVMIEESEKGVEVTEVVKDSAAEKAGLKPGDVITKVNGEKVSTPLDLVNSVKDREPGEVIELIYIRDGEPVRKKVTLQSPNLWKEYEGDDEEIEEIIIIKKKK
jgi:S1-C subfamily serine protease